MRRKGRQGHRQRRHRGPAEHRARAGGTYLWPARSLAKSHAARQVIEREIRDLEAQERHVIIGFLTVIAGALVALGIAIVVIHAAR